MRREVSPKIIVVSLLFTLGVVEGIFYYLSLDRKGEGRMMMGGGGGPPPPPPAGRADVQVTTVAGQPLPGHTDGRGGAAQFDGPAAVAVDRQGYIYVADTRNHVLRRIAPQGEVSTWAGQNSGDPLHGGYADGRADQARFWNPAGIAVDASGVVYVADTGNHCLRRITPDGRVTTLAGKPGPPDRLGFPSGGYADGPGPRARFRFPTGLALDLAGHLIVADTGNHCLRRVSPDGRTLTLAGRPCGTDPAWQAPAGDYADGPADQARFHSPCGVAVAPDGAIYVADVGNHVVRQTVQGRVQTPPAPRWEPPPDALSGLDFSRPPPNPGGNPAPAGVRMIQPTAVAVDARGRVFVADATVNCLQQLVLGEGLRLLAGQHNENLQGAGTLTDGSGDRADFARPTGLAVGPDGAVYVADFNNHCIRRVVVP